MATEKDCSYYPRCGFVALRRINITAEPLPDNGDCGINFNNCGRAKSGNPNSIKDLKPSSSTELDIAFPPGRFRTNRPGGQGRIP